MRTYARVDLPGHALIPGLVNAHTHAAMALMRGVADDLPLMRWLQEHVWPIEAKHASAQFVKDGTLLACAEMLRGGVTCVNDMYFFPEAALEAALAAGMRAALGLIVIEFPSAYAADPEQYLAKGLALRDEWREHPLVTFCLAPHAPYTVVGCAPSARWRSWPPSSICRCTSTCTRRTRRSSARSASTARGRSRGSSASGCSGPNLIAVHAVHLEPAEIALLARHGCSVAHCPSSNLKLASGFAPVAALLAAGVNVALGTDGAASNNRLDLFQEMRSAALLAKAVARDAAAMPAHAALHAATLGGATALGLEQRIGSIVPGKVADLAAVAFDRHRAAAGFRRCFASRLRLRAGACHRRVGGRRARVAGRNAYAAGAVRLARARALVAD